jgi:hypothetical protein
MPTREELDTQKGKLRKVEIQEVISRAIEGRRDQMNLDENEFDSAFGQATPPPNLTCKALYPRTHEDDAQLDMVEGEEFNVLKQNLEGGWTQVKNSSGSIGNVPTTWINIGE